MVCNVKQADVQFIKDWLSGDISYRGGLQEPLVTTGTEYDKTVDRMKIIKFAYRHSGYIGESPLDPYEYWDLRRCFPSTSNNCKQSIGGENGDQFQEDGIWLADCAIFN